MSTLTPATLSAWWQVSLLNDTYLPTIPSPTTRQLLNWLHCYVLQPLRFPHEDWSSSLTPSSLSLHHAYGGSTAYPAESSSLSYGLVFRFQLLPTLSHDNAVTFSYKAWRYLEWDSHSSDKYHSQAHVCRCPHLHKPRRGFLKHNINCKKLYRFNNNGNRWKLVPHDAKEDLCIPIRCADVLICTSLAETF